MRTTMIASAGKMRDVSTLLQLLEGVIGTLGLILTGGKGKGEGESAWQLIPFAA